MLTTKFRKKLITAFGLFSLTLLMSSNVLGVAIDFSTYTVERYPDTSGFGVMPLDGSGWDTTTLGTAKQIDTSNPSASFFYSSQDMTNKIITGKLNPGGDDDLIGFALGYTAGDASSASADFLLLDWKGVTQSFNFDDVTGNFHNLTGTTDRPAGLRLSRVTGTPTADELWGNVDLPENPSGGLDLLAEANTLGRTGYPVNQNSTFKIQYLSNRVTVSVNGIPEIDITGDFGSGGFALFSGWMGASTLPVYSDFEIIDAPPLLKARVNETNGEITLVNEGDVAVAFNSYQLISDAGSLLTGNGVWQSLADNNVDPIGTGEGETWNEAIGSNPSSMGERFLLGSTTLDPMESISLGNAYNTSIGDAQLKFYYNNIATEGFDIGFVEFFTGEASDADFDGDGDVDGSDFLSWQAGFGINDGSATLADGDANGDGNVNGTDLAAWKTQFGSGHGSGSLASGSVPEPSTITLLGLAIGGLVCLRRWKQ